MDLIEQGLKKYPLAISLVLALIIVCLLSSNGVVGQDAMPFGDGQAYAVRAFTLYGYLHSGQWNRFWELFNLPNMNTLAPLHYWIFFLLPPNCADFTAYGITLVATTYFLMAFGIWSICNTFDRKEWSPLIFLLCAVQNVSLEYSLFYFLDVAFFAMGIIALAAQIRAWKIDTIRANLLSGFCAGLLFWVKPANALIFAGTFIIAECVHAGLLVKAARAEREKLSPLLLRLQRHFVGIMAGFLPVLLLALACGGLQVIMLLLDANETTDLYTTRLQCTGLERLLYFPLCLADYYNALFMCGILAVAAIVVKRDLDTRKIKLATAPKPRSFPIIWLLPLIAAYFMLGEYFSFVMDTKTIRSLLLVLPPLWLLVFWVAERCHARLRTICAAICIYVLCAFAQVFFNCFPCETIGINDFQLTGDWLERFPQPINLSQGMAPVTRFVLAHVEFHFPGGGKIAVGTDLLGLTAQSLSWRENSTALLKGSEPIYQFESFLNINGGYKHIPLSGANGLLVYTDFNAVESREIYLATMTLLNYAQTQWQDIDHIARIFPLQRAHALPSDPSLGCLIVLKSPLTDKQIEAAMSATHAIYTDDDTKLFAFHNRRLTWSDYQNILSRWIQKHLASHNP